MYVYGKYSRDSEHAWGLMTNSNYILGPGTRKRISPYNQSVPTRDRDIVSTYSVSRFEKF
jgi:hypothetical protein